MAHQANGLLAIV